MPANVSPFDGSRSNDQTLARKTSRQMSTVLQRSVALQFGYRAKIRDQGGLLRHRHSTAAERSGIEADGLSGRGNTK
jgi:hypothetical protein